MNCSCCNMAMEETVTNFSIVKRSTVFVVRKVPTLECPRCGHLSYRQDVAKKLERFASGRVQLLRPAIQTWQYEYNDPIVEVSGIPVGTKNILVASPVSTGQFSLSLA